jgi:thioredoxin-like negative regulator of GroEL
MELGPNDNFSTIISSSNATLVIFTAPWCGPCKQLKESLKDRRVDIPLLFVDVQDYPILSATYKIRTVPHVCIINNEGVVVKTFKASTAIADLKFLGLIH